MNKIKILIIFTILIGTLQVSYAQENESNRELKISDEGVRLRDELVIENFSSKRIPICGVLGGGYNKDFNKLVELHSILHQSCARLI